MNDQFTCLTDRNTANAIERYDVEHKWITRAMAAVLVVGVVYLAFFVSSL